MKEAQEKRHIEEQLEDKIQREIEEEEEIKKREGQRQLKLGSRKWTFERAIANHVFLVETVWVKVW